MNRQWAYVSLFVTTMICFGAGPAKHIGTSPKVQRPVHTYSIVCRDPATGEIGVAVQSHWFSVGSVVPWAEAGVGAVATQSMVDASYGTLGLDMMRGSAAAPPPPCGHCWPAMTAERCGRWR